MGDKQVTIGSKSTSTSVSTSGQLSTSAAKAASYSTAITIILPSKATLQYATYEDFRLALDNNEIAKQVEQDVAQLHILRK